jgi:hypothetical protein
MRARRGRFRPEGEERERWERKQEERRRRNNERRLEGQRQEVERKREALRKAEEEAAARTQSQAEENSDEGKPHDQRRKDEAPRVHGLQQISRRTEAKAGDQATETSAAPLEHDTGAASPTMNEECSESHLISQVIYLPFTLLSIASIDIHSSANLRSVLCAAFSTDHTA